MKTPYNYKNPIPEKEKEKFCNDVEKLARKRFGDYPDGSLPVQIKIIDRTQYEHMHFLPIKYCRIEYINEKILDDIRRTVGINLNQANEQYHLFEHYLQEYLKKQKE